MNCLAWAQDGSLLLSSSDDCMVRLWSPAEGGAWRPVHAYHSGGLQKSVGEAGLTAGNP